MVMLSYLLVKKQAPRTIVNFTNPFDSSMGVKCGLLSSLKNNNIKKKTRK